MQITIRNPNLQFSRPPGRRSRTERIVIHHLAADVSVETVHRWHLGNGWVGIGYHFQIEFDGTIWSGRPVDTVGAHTAGHNERTIGIACRGNFETLQTMPEAQRTALIRLLRHLRGAYGNIPVSGHRELTATACPGRFFPLDEIRRQIEIPENAVEREEANMTEVRVKELITQTVQEMLTGTNAKPSPWARPEWERAIEANITDGTRPRGYVTREEAAIMAYRAGRAE